MQANGHDVVDNENKYQDPMYNSAPEDGLGDKDTEKELLYKNGKESSVLHNEKSQFSKYERNSHSCEKPKKK